jgi:hypothetical protein
MDVSFLNLFTIESFGEGVLYTRLIMPQFGRLDKAPFSARPTKRRPEGPLAAEHQIGGHQRFFQKPGGYVKT